MSTDTRGLACRQHFDNPLTTDTTHLHVYI